MTALVIVFLSFIGGSIWASVTTNSYFQALARASDAVSSNRAVLDEFLRQPTRMPAANVRETRRRLSALVRGQSDPQLESLRQQALIATVFALASFVAILVVSSR